GRGAHRRPASGTGARRAAGHGATQRPRRITTATYPTADAVRAALAVATATAVRAGRETVQARAAIPTTQTSTPSRIAASRTAARVAVAMPRLAPQLTSARHRRQRLRREAARPRPA